MTTTAYPDACSRLEAIAHHYGVTVRGNGARIPCPAHQGTDPNLALYVGYKDYVGAYCHSRRCEFKAIAKAISEATGVSLYPTHDNSSAKPRKSFETARYQHPDGKERVSYRKDYPRDFGPGPCNWKSTGAKKRCGRTNPHKHSWNSKGLSVEGTLPHVWGKDDGLCTLILAEGEKSAKASQEVAQQTGCVAVSLYSGAHHAAKSNFEMFRGRHVLIWADADAAGGHFVDDCIKELQAVGVASIRLVPFHAAPKGDAADYDPDYRAEVISGSLVLPEISAPPPPAEPTPEAHVHPPKDATEWQTLGRLLAERHRDKFRYDSERRAWWGWQGTHWREITDTTAITDPLSIDRMRLAADLAEQGNSYLSNYLINKFERSAGTGHGDLWASLRMTMARPTPAPPHWQVATPDGVVDVQTGKMEPHDPLKHDNLTVTRGHYRPMEADELSGLLYGGRLQHNISQDDYETLLKLLGLAVTRKATDHRSVLWLYGVSGGGKTMTANLALAAFGRHAWYCTLDMLERRVSDIDAGMADLLEANPCIIVCDELGGNALKQKRFLTLTGGGEYQARRPHGKMIRRTLSALWIAPTVTPPRMEANEGMARRTVAIGFDRLYPEDSPRRGSFDPDELDAVVTLALIEAKRVYEAGDNYRPPQGNVQKRRELLGEMDELLKWLEELGDEYDGAPQKDTREAASEDLGRRVNAKAFGQALKGSNRWYTDRKGKGGQYRIHLNPERLEGMDEW